MTTVMTRYGAVRGQERDGVSAFLGIPYAASPTGPLRFAAPQPPARWDGERDCTAFGPTPPKPDYVPPYDTLLPEPNIAGSDWLNLNVWTPDTSARLPVMVWIHGGAFSNGNSAVSVYDGHAFGRDGVVLVSINYRLGVDGFALLPDAPPNRGLLDQIAALEWVRDNIAAFGGDPANVTIFGESAGAMSVTVLLTMPQARGLFSKAISQSGSVQAGAAPADAALVTGELGAALGMAATAAALATIDLPTLIRAQATVRDALGTAPDPARFGPTIVASAMAFQPVVDGQVLAQHPLEAIAAGAGADIPLLTGTTSEEFRLFMAPSGLLAMITDEILPGLLAPYGVSPEVAELYKANRSGASAGDVAAALVTDRYFRLPMLAVAEARTAGPAPTYLYEFGWRSPAADLGAAHSLELPFVFDTLTADRADRTLGAAPPAKLAKQMHEAWIRFAASADPGWPKFDLSYPVMTWDGEAAEVVSDPRGDERLAWQQP